MEIKDILEFLEKEASEGRIEGLRACYNLYMRVYNHKINPGARQIANREYKKKVRSFIGDNIIKEDNSGDNIAMSEKISKKILDIF